MVTGQEPRPGRSRSERLVPAGIAAALSLVMCSKEQASAPDGARTGAASPALAAPGPGADNPSHGTGESGAGRVAPAPGLTLRGAVVDLEGEPLPEVAVRASEVDGARSFPEGKAPRTDAQGRFEIAGVPAGQVRILVVAPRGGATEYSQAMFTTQIAGGPIVELAPIRLARRKVKAGEAAGDLGYALQEPKPGPDPQARKFIVAAVRPGGPGELAGLRVGDEIVAVNGEDVTGERRYLYPQLVQVPAGEVMKLGLSGGRTVEVTAGAPP